MTSLPSSHPAEAPTSEPADLLMLAAHELRTPLHAVRGFVELVLTGTAGPLSAEALDYLGQVARAGRKLEVVLDRLHELSAPAPASRKEAARPIDLGMILAAHGFRPLTGGAAVTTIIGSTGAWDRIVGICADYLRAGEAALPSLHASFAFMGDGGLSLTMSCDDGRHADGTGMLSILLARRLALAEGARLEADLGRVVVTWPKEAVMAWSPELADKVASYRSPGEGS